jgi:vanillate O-demethylase ferredoxin subunit
MIAATIPMRLHGIWQAAHKSLLFELRSDAGPVPPAAAGAHIQLVLPTGVTRAYSLVNPGDAEPRYVIGVKHADASRGGSRWLHEQARVGMRLEVVPPQNHFALDEQAPHTVLFAGGIGITPLWSMVQRLQQLGAPWSLEYGVRTRGEMLFARELQALGSRVRVTAQDEAQLRGEPGYLDIAARVAAAPAGTHFYCCGPAPMMDAFTAATAHLPPATVHLEYFSPAQPAAQGGGYTVQLRRSDIELTIAPGQSILDAVRARGVSVPSSCEQGVCGSCETRVLAGTPDHRDSVLTQQEKASNQTLMICCSGCVGSRLVLDL